VTNFAFHEHILWIKIIRIPIEKAQWTCE